MAAKLPIMPFGPFRILLFVCIIFCTCKSQKNYSIEGNSAGLMGVKYSGNEKWRIPPMYDRIEPVINRSYFWVRKNGKWGLINKRGKIILPLIYDSFSEETINGLLYYAKTGNKTAVVSFRRSVFCSPPLYDSAFAVVPQRFESYVFVKNGNKYGVISPKCRTILAPVYDTIEIALSDVFHGSFLFCINQKCGIADMKGDVILPPLYDSLALTVTNEFDNGFEIFLNDSLVYIKENGKISRYIPQLPDEKKRYYGDYRVGQLKKPKTKR